MNNNRNPRGEYPPNSGRGYTYNSNQSSGNYNGNLQNQSRKAATYEARQVNPQRNAQYQGGQNVPQGRPRQSAYSGQRRPSPTANRQMKQPMNWVPLFMALLVLMISVGIFCTVMNSRSRVVNAGRETEADTVINENRDTDSAYENDPLKNPNKIAVSYASATNDTIELGNSITSDYGILIDLKTNTVVAQKNPDSTIFPASMTKIMTLIVAYENCDNFNDTFTMTAEITDPLFIAGASVAGFSVGEEITIRDLLYGAILPSGGDATDALAIYTAGSIDAFVDMMNRKVLEMGLSNTHFANPSGLHDDDHYSTPHEIALILEYALQIEECREILSTYQYTTNSTPQHPDGILLTSTMFSRMAGDESGVATIIGGKTGYTNEGLHCLASYAKVNGGNEYIFVTAHAPGTYDPVYDCINTYKNLFGEE